MKRKNILLALLSLTAGSAMAQHYDLIDQNGNNNLSSVIQNFLPADPSIIGNNAYSIQDGETNQALIDQLGSANKTFSYQTTADHRAQLIISGSENTALTIQVGIGDKVFARQSGKDNLLYAVQAGNGNLANIYMHAEESDALVKQYGDNNTATQIMGEGFLDFLSVVNEPVADCMVINSTFKVLQDGKNNISYQEMDGSGILTILNENNKGLVEQTGENNSSQQFIKNLATDGYARNNYLELTQDGDANLSLQDIMGSGNESLHFQLSAGNSASNTVIGNNNRSFSEQR